MLIRQVLHNGDTNKWAYVERSTSNDYFTILGGKEFDTKEEALEFREGFTLDSYTWIDSEMLKIKKITEKRLRLISEIQALDEEADYRSLDEDVQEAAGNYANLEDSCWANDYNGFMAGANYVLNKYGLLKENTNV